MATPFSRARPAGDFQENQPGEPIGIGAAAREVDELSAMVRAWSWDSAGEARPGLAQ
jgi:hypothetical protein